MLQGIAQVSLLSEGLVFFSSAAGATALHRLTDFFIYSLFADTKRLKSLDPSWEKEPME